MSSADNYKNYVQWKGWRLFEPGRAEVKIFQREFLNISFAKKNHLDIGFGAGSLLSWSRSSGANICGIEIQPELLSAAEALGIEVYKNISEIDGERFDIVTVFDVLEHLSKDDIGILLSEIVRISRSGATVFLRAPNCQSALGLICQFGDPTHITMLSGPILKSLVESAGMTFVEARNAHEAFSGDTLIQSIGALVKSFIKFTHLKLIRYIYFSGAAPLAKNVLLIAKVVK